MNSRRYPGCSFHFSFGWRYGWNLYVSRQQFAVTLWFFVFRITFGDYERAINNLGNQHILLAAKVRAYEQMTGMRLTLTEAQGLTVQEPVGVQPMPAPPPGSN